MSAIKVILVLVALQVAITLCEQNWTFDLLSVASNSSDATFAEVELNVIRIARGRYAVSGFLDIKADLLDDTVVTLSIERSTTGLDEDMKATPFRIDGDSLTTFMNSHYKDSLLPTARGCATEYPDFERFQAPLTKRRVEMNNCNVPLEGYPDQMAEGKYRILGSIKTPLHSMNLDIKIYINEK